MRIACSAHSRTELRYIRREAPTVRTADFRSVGHVHTSSRRVRLIPVFRPGSLEVSERSAGLGEIARVFLKIGAMSYGGPAIMGIMQTEIQEKRRWIEKPQFVEGLALVNMLPGPGATQLGIYLGHTRAGLAGGIIAGLC